MKNEHTKSLCWIELVVVPDSRRQSMAGRIHTVRTGERTCCAISVDERWLSCSDGGATMFDRPEAAEKFLRMVGINADAGEDRQLDVCCGNARQCFHLTEQGGLGQCPHNQRRQTRGERLEYAASA